MLPVCFAVSPNKQGIMNCLNGRQPLVSNLVLFEILRKIFPKVCATIFCLDKWLSTGRKSNEGETSLRIKNGFQIVQRLSCQAPARLWGPNVCRYDCGAGFDSG